MPGKYYDDEPADPVDDPRAAALARMQDPEFKLNIGKPEITHIEPGSEERELQLAKDAQRSEGFDDALAKRDWRAMNAALLEDPNTPPDQNQLKQLLALQKADSKLEIGEPVLNYRESSPEQLAVETQRLRGGEDDEALLQLLGGMFNPR